MRMTKIALAAALTLVSGAAFAASGKDRVSDAMKRGVAPVAMERQVDQRPATITGLPASEPTIFGHAPLSLTYGLPRHNNS